ncbi:MAG: hypothetical protein RIF46_04155 [Cyclobacteriaceae bacterium]
MKKTALIILYMGLCGMTWAQTSPEEIEEHIDVLHSPDGWLKESFDFPLSFAPSIAFSGFEELRFDKNWNDSTSQAFWSYMFVWYLDEDPKMTLDKLEVSLKAYYDGLMRVEYSTSEFRQLEDGSFVGNVETFDNFFTKKDFTLNVKVRPSYCANSGKYACLFYISSSTFGKEIWSQLEGIAMVEECE